MQSFRAAGRPACDYKRLAGPVDTRCVVPVRLIASSRAARRRWISSLPASAQHPSATDVTACIRRCGWPATSARLISPWCHRCHREPFVNYERAEIRRAMWRQQTDGRWHSRSSLHSDRISLRRSALRRLQWVCCSFGAFAVSVSNAVLDHSK